MISELLLNFNPGTSLKSFMIEDASIYNPNLPITCGQLSVKAPGFTYPHTFEPLPEFKLKINLGNLGLQNTDSVNCLGELPDGNYEIRYSINPNDKLFVEYNYYNVAKLNSLYIKQLCNYFNNMCNMSKKEQTAETDRLFEIRQLIEYAKHSAEDCGDVNQADDLYNSAKDKLNKRNECKGCK